MSRSSHESVAFLDRFTCRQARARTIVNRDSRKSLVRSPRDGFVMDWQAGSQKLPNALQRLFGIGSQLFEVDPEHALARLVVKTLREDLRASN